MNKLLFLTDIPSSSEDIAVNEKHKNILKKQKLINKNS